MFKTGDLLIYPTQGLAEVQGIESKTLGDKKADFYILRIVAKNLAIMVPTANEARIGLRKVISVDEVAKVQEILSAISDIHYTQWHHRYSDNFDKLKSGSIFQTAEVVRDLHYLKRKKNLAIKESRMMDNAMQLLVSEISASLSISPEQAKEWVKTALG
jgi:CarD family transcriptional regulator